MNIVCLYIRGLEFVVLGGFLLILIVILVGVLGIGDVGCDVVFVVFFVIVFVMVWKIKKFYYMFLIV